MSSVLNGGDKFVASSQSSHLRKYSVVFRSFFFSAIREIYGPFLSRLLKATFSTEAGRPSQTQGGPRPVSLTSWGGGEAAGEGQI